MPFNATVLRVMIASPSDVPEARDEIERAIHGWNDANARSKGVILQPWRWESASVPVMGGHPQRLINSQGVDDSDIVFAIFGSRLGSPTPDAVSGTVEEIDRAVASGKPVHLYFSSAPLPNDVDTSQLDALREFRLEVQNRGLLGEFSNPSQLGHEVWKAIEHDLSTLDLAPAGEARATRGVDFLVQPQQERELKGYRKNGNPQYSTSHWAEVTNTGDRDAEGVRFESLSDAMHLVSRDAGTTIHRGQTRRVPYVLTWGSGDAPMVLRVRWEEDGESRERDFHVE